jgi:hypothetical protein
LAKGLALVCYVQVWHVKLPPAPARPPTMPLPPNMPLGEGTLAGAAGFSNCGIHALALSPDGSMLATGGTTPSDCQIMRVTRGGGGGAYSGTAPELTPVQTLVVRLIYQPVPVPLLRPL